MSTYKRVFESKNGKKDYQVCLKKIQKREEITKTEGHTFPFLLKDLVVIQFEIILIKQVYSEF